MKGKATMGSSMLLAAALVLASSAAVVSGVTPGVLAHRAAPAVGAAGSVSATAVDTRRPANPVKLVFIHHSTGENWLADGHGGLGIALRNANYFVSDTNYGWGPGTVGDRTDIGNWWEWFRGPSSRAVLSALLAQSDQNCSYARLASDPSGPNEIVVFKSCFPNSALRGSATAAPPPIGSNPLKGRDAGDDAHTVANAKGIYIDLLEYFKTRRDTLFVVICAPPLSDGTYARNARVFNDWLVDDWLTGYPYKNVFVFDFYNVLTTNGGGPSTSDVGQTGGNHHRVWQGAIQHKTDGDDDSNPNVLEYATSSGDDHPSPAGGKKATAEFVPMLSAAYNAWKASIGATSTASLSRPVVSVSPVRKGRYFYVAGRLSPAHAASAAVRLYFYRRIGGRYRLWRSVATRTAAGSTRYRARCRVTYAGAWYVRAYHSDADHAASRSAVRYFRAR